MTTTRQRARAVFAEVSKLKTPQEQADRLAELCDDDPEVRRFVQSLLAAQGPAAAFFSPIELGRQEAASPARAHPTTVQLTAPAITVDPGSVILGRYELCETIGEGAFGRVFRAQQLEPVRREVALKILKVGMDTQDIIARFEAERQALALMDHQHVAHVLDAGTTPAPDGRPFFVMELVDGEPITEYCELHHLTLRQQIELILPVCHAVQHAHQKGIIHRDIKPSNILIATRDGRPHPMVIDFGIAKALQEPLIAEAQLTRVDQIVGTPAYMSPEQATFGSPDIDTRTDIYALGIVLYELLTGQTPFPHARLREAGPAGMQRILQEEDPPSLSGCLRQQAAALRPEDGEPPGPLLDRAELLRGELNWIAQKALAKDRDHRYATANALARDLERYLHDEPVQARAPSASYLARKFVRRHRHAAAAAAGILTSLILGLFLATLGFLDAREKGHLARLAEDRATVEALHSRRIAYASDMNLAQVALDNSNLGLARAILRRQIPQPAQLDLRNWEWRYLNDACQSDAAFTLGHHDHAVTSLAVDRTGRWLASAGLDGTVTLWDLTQRAPVFRLPGGGSQVALTPDAKLLATSNPQAGVQLWDVETRTATLWLPDDHPMTDLLFDPAGIRLLAASQTGQLHSWLLPPQHGAAFIKSEVTLSQGLHTGDLLLAPRLNQLFIGDDRGQMQSFDALTGEPRNHWQAHQQAITALALAPDETVVATGAGFADPSLRLWRAETGEAVGDLTDHQAWISAITFTPDNRFLISASADQTIRLWRQDDLQAGITLRGHLHEIWSLACLPDGQTLISGDKHGTLLGWRLLDHLAPGTRPDPFSRQTTFANDQGPVIGLDREGRVQLLRPNASHPPPRLDHLGRGNRQLAVAPQADYVAIADANGIIRIDHLVPRSMPTPPLVLATNPALSDLRFSPDGRHLVMISDGHMVQAVATASWKPVAFWDSGEQGLGSIAISPDGNLLASGGDLVTLYDLLSGQPTAEIESHRQPTDAVAFSPDGRHLATGSQEGLAKLWDIANCSELAVFEGHLLGVHAVAFSPNGTRLATGSVGDEAVKLWDLVTRQEVLNLAWPGELVSHLAFSPDGNTLIAANRDSHIRAWRAPPAVHPHTPSVD